MQPLYARFLKGRPGRSGYGHCVAGARPSLIEFPADDPARALRFWGTLLGTELQPRTGDQGAGWETRGSGPAVGVHERGRGPGDSFSLPYFEVADVAATAELDYALARGGNGAA